jgi:hypothetical protein
MLEAADVVDYQHGGAARVGRSVCAVQRQAGATRHAAADQRLFEQSQCAQRNDCHALQGQADQRSKGSIRRVGSWSTGLLQQSMSLCGVCMLKNLTFHFL